VEGFTGNVSEKDILKEKKERKKMDIENKNYRNERRLSFNGDEDDNVIAYEILKKKMKEKMEEIITEINKRNQPILQKTFVSLDELFKSKNIY
jgi:hypothetical protein